MWHRGRRVLVERRWGRLPVELLEADLKRARSAGALAEQLVPKVETELSEQRITGPIECQDLVGVANDLSLDEGQSGGAAEEARCEVEQGLRIV